MRLIRGLLRLMAAGDILAVAAIVLQLDGPGTRRFEVAPSALPVGQPSTGLRIQAVSVTVEHPTTGQTLLDLLAGPLPFALATLPMIWYALRLLDRIADAQPFTEAVAAGLRRLGVIVLIAAGASEVVRAAGLFLLESTVVPPGERMVLLDFTFSAWWVVLALVLFAFAQIIGYGRQLRAELDEVI
ncbi:DUF2975 domain-containing protein [Actinoplanes sp. NPDC049265]|uniref:DUF2975 domain-containing protein n=1 Tax=Actinoplanes sp. NPDC049265 TaxID=3363902 RepID=UPI00371A4ECD